MQSITNSIDEETHKNPMIKDIPYYQDPTYRPQPKATRTPMPEDLQSTNINPEINTDFKEILHFKKA